jgi:DNA-binding IclR family transcriptional regulator
MTGKYLCPRERDRSVTENDNLVGAVERAVDVLDAIVELEEATATRIATHLGMPISTTHNHLATLEERELVIRHEDKSYDVSFRFLEIGGGKRNTTELYAKARSEVDELAEDTGDLANLVVEEHGRGVHLYLSRGKKAVNLDSYPGMRSYLHTTATGKAILAHLPPDRVDAIVERHGLVRRTENTITDGESLAEELATVRDRGFALDRQERLNGLRCVAAPILTNDDELLGAVSVSGPVKRFGDTRFREELPSVVSGVADVIAINSEYN